MAYLLYTARDVQVVHDEKMEEYRTKKDSPVVLARFSLSVEEAKMTIDELMKIYPHPRKRTDDHKTP